MEPELDKAAFSSARTPSVICDVVSRTPVGMSTAELAAVIPSLRGPRRFGDVAFLQAMWKKISMDSKEEISDTDSGIILQCGPDSPTSPMKDMSTQAVKLLQDRLELCLIELKELCIREAELTGQLSSDYPQLPGEKPPIIRRHVGTAFALAEDSIPQGEEHPELGPLEAELALQLQIYKAARQLYQEDNLSKAVKRSRRQQCHFAETKVKELQEAAFQLRLRLGRGSPHPPRPHKLRDLGTSDDTSLSDSALQDEEDVPSQDSDLSLEASPEPDPLRPPQGSPQLPHHVPQFAPLRVLGELKPGYSPNMDYDRPPIQNSPWKESSLDEPYQKPKKTRSTCCSQTSSPMVTPVSTPVDPQFGSSAHPLQFMPIKSLALCHDQSNTATCTPELQLHRQQSQSFRLPNRELSHEPEQTRGRPRLARRRIADFVVVPGECIPLQVGLGFQSSSEDSSSEHSAPSYTSSPCCDFPMVAADPCRAPYGYPHTSPHGGPLAYAGPHYRPLAYAGPHDRPLAYAGPHDRPLAYAGPHDEPLAFAGPHNRPLAFTGPHDGPLAYAGPRGRPLAYSGPHDGPLAYTVPSFYKNPMHQSSPSFYRGYIEEDVGYPPEMDIGKLYLGPPPGPPSRYEYRYEEVPPQQLLRPLPTHVRLARAPSLREHPPHPHSGGLPRHLVSEGLKCYQQRSQQVAPRPRSLDRQGAVRVRGMPERESPLTHRHRQHRPQQQQPHRYQEQVPQRLGLQRASDGTPAQWFMQEDSEIASQV
ncbi:hypothetical protein SKAU_G00280040 [Synaphobranchus kaupii]|uniref:Cytohesin Ubiquitin Protein Inducing domain-containing protein n=1 Tax=Synaphobranchus kaupii TaxID=118154 RepID=A0A9Q1EX14_SYNKA|nr:hypothetical protein SKAU_G00280040 [Synaphobranchus kaupii]